MSTLQQRAQEAIDAGFKPADMARAADVTNASVSHWLAGRTRKLKADSAIGLQKLTGWSADWWSTGRPPKQANSPKMVGRPMSLEAATLLPTPITWEEVMAAERLHERFVVKAPDDQAAPKCPSGVLCVWSTVKPPRPGRVVLIRDAHGQLHIREYRQGKAPGHWIATAINPAYATLESQEDGLTHLATLAGVIEGDD